MSEREQMADEFRAEIIEIQDKLRQKYPGFGVLGVHVQLGEGTIAWIGPALTPTRKDLELVSETAAMIGRELGLQVTISAADANFPKALLRH